MRKSASEILRNLESRIADTISSLYKERLGLEEYIHYIPIEFD